MSVLFVWTGMLYGREGLSPLQREYRQADHDTTRISLLFKMGNLYIDGPSDSLLYYYHHALSIIDSLRKEKIIHRFPSSVQSRFMQQHYRALVEIGIENFFQGNYDSSLAYYSDALVIAREIDDPGLISEVYGALGIVYKNQGAYDVALGYYENALAAAIELKDTSWIAACYSNAGNVYRRLGNYTKALDYFLKALEVFEQYGETRRITISYLNIGNLYEDQQDMHTALEYYSRALSLAYETNDSKRISECLMNIGNVYINEQKFATARDYFFKSIAINEENGFYHTQDDCYKHVGLTYEKEGDYDRAIENYNISYEIASAEGDMITLAEISGNLSQIYLNLGQFEESRQYAEKSLEIALQTRDPQNIRNAYLYLSGTWEKLGDERNALHFYKLYVAVNDSLFDSEKYRAIKDLEMKYETEKKEQELALLSEKSAVQQLKLSRRNRFLLASLIVVVLVIIIGYILYRNQRLRARHRSIELEQKLLRSQMNPHFIFNSLIAIQSYIYKKDVIRAGDFLAKFADLVRITLENSRNEFVKMEKEIRMLHIYMELQALRFDYQFDYSVEVDQDLDPEHVQIPPMMAQPFVENAIEHGLRHLKGQGYIRVKFSKGNGCIRCLVEDNGIGRKQSRIAHGKSSHKSMATSITLERIEILKKRFRKGYNLQINDLDSSAQENVGTIVEFTMPFLDN